MVIEEKDIESCRDLIIENLEIRNIGNKSINYKLRDWGVSRQRYWGCPIPVIYYEDGSYRVLDKDELPIILPYEVSLEGKGNALLKNDNWRKVICPKTKRQAYRETDTLDTFVDSSWYYIRFLNNKLKSKVNRTAIFAKKPRLTALLASVLPYFSLRRSVEK